MQRQENSRFLSTRKSIMKHAILNNALLIRSRCIVRVDNIIIQSGQIGSDLSSWKKCAQNDENKKEHFIFPQRKKGQYFGGRCY